MSSLRHVAVTVLDKLASQVGLRVIPQWRLHGLPQSQYLSRLFCEGRVSSVIDVGANAGQYYDFLRNEVGYCGPVLSVEPIPSFAQRLAQRAEGHSGWRIENLALGPSAGRVEFNVMEHSEFSSILAPAEFTKNYFSHAGEIRESVNVAMETLDQLIARHRDFLGGRIYLKLDTQGYDLLVMKGLDLQHDQVIAVQTEASITPLYDGAPDYHQSISALTDRGFTLSGFYHNNSGHFPRLLEFDCHLVRLDALASQ
jgi:FkbM family methyltransferase